MNVYLTKCILVNLISIINYSLIWIPAQLITTFIAATKSRPGFNTNILRAGIGAHTDKDHSKRLWGHMLLQSIWLFPKIRVYLHMESKSLDWALMKLLKRIFRATVTNLLRKLQSTVLKLLKNSKVSPKIRSHSKRQPTKINLKSNHLIVELTSVMILRKSL